MEKLLTPKQVADRYGGTPSETTLANWRAMRTGPPYVKIGGRVLYPQEQLFEWERRRTVRTIDAR